MADQQVSEVTAADGRAIAYVEVGDPHSPLVIHNHGGPSSRLEARLFAGSATKHRLRLVCVDRPGMDGPVQPRTVPTRPGLTTWSRSPTRWATTNSGHGLVGGRPVGAGGRGLYRRPTASRHVSSIAGGSYGAFGDNWAADQLSKADTMGGTLALRFEPGFRLMYAAIGLTARDFRRAYMQQVRKAVNDYDRRILLRPDFEASFGESSAECFAQGSDGLVRDSELLYRKWAFDVEAIDRAVHMWQGTDDRLVAAPINKAVSDRMPGAIWHSVEGAGHFVAVGAADDVFAIAAHELSA